MNKNYIHRFSGYIAAVFISGSLFINVSAVYSSELLEMIGLENGILTSFDSGDYISLYENIEKLLVAFPTAPESYLYYPDLARLADVSGYEKVRHSLESLLSIVRERGGARANLYELILNLELEKLLSRHDGISAAKYSGGLFSVRTWQLMGPYVKHGPADLEYSFLPEIAGSLNDRILQKKTVTLKNSDGVLNLDDRLFPRQGVAYAFTTLKSDGTRKLRIYSKAHYKLFINGREALKNIPGEIYRTCRIVRIQTAGSVSIMMKVYKSEDWKFRVIVTDDQDKPVPVEAGPADYIRSACDYSEVFDHPYYEFIKRLSGDRSGSSFKIGNYFEELGSREAVRFYRQSLTQSFSPGKKYFFARCLIDNGQDNADSALSMEGRRLMSELAEKAPGYVPARQWQLNDYIARNETRKAFNSGRDLIRQAPRSLPAREEYCRFLGTLPSDKEFTAELAEFIRWFPDSPVPLRVLADYYRDRNTDRCIDVCLSVFKKGFDRHAFEILLSIYQKRERFDDALRLIDALDSRKEYENERTNILISSGRFEEAKKRIFKSMIDMEDPNAYVRLGLVSYLQGEDPAMDWSRALIMDPSNFSVGDLLDSLVSGGKDHPFSGKRIEKGEDHVVSSYLNPPRDAQSRVLLRGKIILLNNDGSSRAFCEEVIFINDRKGVERWGEYRIDQTGEIHPVRVRVYAPDGSVTDSYSLERVNGAYYINLPSVKEKSIIHVSYYTDNPYSADSGSRLMSVPFSAIQDFDEAVDNFYLQVIAPKDMPVRFSCSDGVKPAMEKSGTHSIYSIRLKNLPALKKEGYLGNGFLHLPYYALSTFEKPGDFVRWYNGMLVDAFSLDESPLGYAIRGKNINDIAARLYLKVSREIDLTGHVLFYPEKAANTVFRKRGTVEDKVILAKAVLNNLGIRSYIAFSQRKEFPQTGGYISPDIFSHILLYVPIAINEGVFLDFSSRYGTYGAVDPSIEGAEALVIVRDGYELKKVKSLSIAAVSSHYELNLDGRGNASFILQMGFYGSLAGSRSNFMNKMYREEVLNRLLVQSLPAPEIDGYRFENLESAAAPLRIVASGNCHGLSIHFQKRILLQPVLNRSAVMKYILLPLRTYPLMINEPVNESERYTYRLPAEWAVSTVDESRFYQCRFGYASISMKKMKGSNKLEVQKEVHVMPGRIDPDQYTEFLDFCKKLGTGEARRIILEK